MLKNSILQKFLLFCKKKKTFFFFYFTLLLQNTCMDLSILQIYSIKYSFYYIFIIISFNLLSLSLPISFPSILILSLFLSVESLSYSYRDSICSSKKKKKIVAQPQSPTIIQGTFTNARARKMTNSPHSITQTTQKIPKKKKKFIHKPKKS